MRNFGPNAPTRPDWVIVGALQQGHHFVYASRELDQIELEAVYDDEDPWAWYRNDSWPVLRLRHIEIRGRLRSYVVVRGTSYADCLARLADFGAPGEWRAPGPPPDLEPRLELGAGPLALERRNDMRSPGE